MKTRSDREATHMAVAAGVYVLDASAVGVAAKLARPVEPKIESGLFWAVAF